MAGINPRLAQSEMIKPPADPFSFPANRRDRVLHHQKNSNGCAIEILFSAL
ncbi:MAG: hypothetical protein AAFW82_06965 [Pseudomonadota bacterium]